MDTDISIIIPTRNRCNYLLRAISSCFQSNDQVKVEVIVVDDDSTDGSFEAVAALRDPRITLLRQDRRGAQVARNTGMRRARGAYIKFLDDDDWLAAETLSKEIAALRRTCAGYSSGDLWMVDEAGEKIDLLPGITSGNVARDILSSNVTTHPLRFTILKELAQSLAWDETLLIKQDVDYFLRLAFKSCNTVYVPGEIGFVTHHPGDRITYRYSLNEGIRKQLALMTQIVEKHAKSPERVGMDKLYAAADGLWTWIHYNSYERMPEVDQAWKLIEHIHGDSYLPCRPNAILRLLDRLFTPMSTERLLAPMRAFRLKVGRKSNHIPFHTTIPQPERLLSMEPEAVSQR